MCVVAITSMFLTVFPYFYLETITDVYFNKALKLKKANGTLTLVGIGSFAEEIALAKVEWNNGWSEEADVLYAFMALAEIPTTLISFPTFVKRFVKSK